MVSPESRVRDVKAQAQEQLKRRFLALSFRHQRLDVESGLAELGVRDGNIVDAIVQPIQLACTTGAFALHATGGSLLAWGDPAYAGDSSQVRERLVRVQQVQATFSAFAAVLRDGSVVTWGDPDEGGDSSHVQEQLVHVQQIQATHGAFAAILDDGSVVTWGDPDEGGDSSHVQEQLVHVQQIQATHGAFAAILDDGSVVTWGIDDYGGDSRQVQEQLVRVRQIHATCGAFAAILDDGSVVAWVHVDFTLKLVFVDNDSSPASNNRLYFRGVKDQPRWPGVMNGAETAARCRSSWCASRKSKQVPVRLLPSCTTALC